MPNPIRPLGRPINQWSFDSSDIENEGRRQDRERRLREDEEYFRRTGMRRPPIMDFNPLVDSNPSPDIANDGDSYVEDNPSELLETHESFGISKKTSAAHNTNLKQKEDEEFKRLVEENRKKMGNAIDGIEL